MTINKSGYAALVGRPNVGKSTLMNHLCGEKISITTPKPQTTRWQILGIKTEGDAQIVYMDTPGLHEEEINGINRYMNRVARSVLHEADVIIFLVDATAWQKEDSYALEVLKTTDKPVILALNKIDLVKNKSDLLPLIDELKSKLNFQQIIPISALDGENTDKLEAEIIKFLPMGEQIFPEDQLTDKSVRFLVGEIIREKIIQATEKELPYTTAVEIEQFKESEKLIEISALIYVERPGQKVIIIGKKGELLKKIGTQARLEMEKLLDKKVFLRLWIKVKEDWRDDERALKNLGYE